jgi:hypothetical protein
VSLSFRCMANRLGRLGYLSEAEAEAEAEGGVELIG